MDENLNKEPAKRFRSILSSQDEESNAQSKSQSQIQPSSPLSKLPRLKPSAQSTPLSDTQPVARQAPNKTPPSAPLPVPPPQEAISPPVVSRARLHQPASIVTQEQSGQASPHPPVGNGQPVRDPNGEVQPRRGLKLGPPFWTITGILSLIVNGILIAVLLVLFNMLGPLQGLQGQASNLGSSILGGLYSNFEKMDRATIKTTIPVDAQIPLDISVPVQTSTQITLAESVSIPNAQVVINTGGLNINSNARVTLPAGTPLMVNLNFNLPVQTTIPVHLDVPVNIPMNQTELHEPFVGLQNVVRPLYCLVESDAANLDGQLICR